jgi:hypothetical protein
VISATRCCSRMLLLEHLFFILHTPLATACC